MPLPCVVARFCWPPVENNTRKKSPGIWAAAGAVTEFNVPSGTAFGITAGPDGNLWFTEELAGEIGRITTS